MTQSLLFVSRLIGNSGVKAQDAEGDREGVWRAQMSVMSLENEYAGNSCMLPENDEHGFQQPKRKKTRISSGAATDNGMPLIYNSFGALNMLNLDDQTCYEDGDSQTLLEEDPVKNDKLPQIILTEKITNYSKCIESVVNKYTKIAVKLRYSANGLSVQTTTLIDYLELNDELKKDNISFFTYTPKWLKNKHIVAKGLSKLPLEDIKSDLHRQGLKCDKIAFLKKNKAVTESYQYPIYIFTFDKDVNIQKVWSIQYLCHVKVKWEKYKNSRWVTQCHNCQMFGHGTRFYQNKPRCVMCEKKTPH